MSGTPDLATSYAAGTIPELPARLRARIEASKLPQPRLAKTEAGAAEVQPVAPSSPRDLPTARETAYAAKALADEAATLASRGSGRNAALNHAALALGELVGAGWIDRVEVENTLRHACQVNGYQDKDGEQAVSKTLKSGIEAECGTHVRRWRTAIYPLLPTVIDFVARLASFPGASQATSVANIASTPAGMIVARPFEWRDPADIPQRQWLYGNHYIRQFISTTIAPGGLGKSSLIVAEAVAMVTGRNLIAHQPSNSLRVWLFNGEDPYDELQRRIAAFMLHHCITSSEIGNRLYITSGRDTEFFIAETTHGTTTLSIPNYNEIIQQIRQNNIDVLIIDPFISSHKVAENDNNGIDLVVKAWNKIANATGCAIELVHHARKGNGDKTTVDDARGASALNAAARSVRTLNRMTADEGSEGRH